MKFTSDVIGEQLKLRIDISLIEARAVLAGLQPISGGLHEAVYEFPKQLRAVVDQAERAAPSR